MPLYFSCRLSFPLSFVVSFLANVQILTIFFRIGIIKRCGGYSSWLPLLPAYSLLFLRGYLFSYFCVVSSWPRIKQYFRRVLWIWKGRVMGTWDRIQECGHFFYLQVVELPTLVSGCIQSVIRITVPVQIHNFKFVFIWLISTNVSITPTFFYLFVCHLFTFLFAH